VTRKIGIFGKHFSPGDTAVVPGNTAWELVVSGSAVFTDPKLKQEQEILDAAKKLERPIKARELAAFRTRTDEFLFQRGRFCRS
jgi:hypothetical protein